MKEKHYLIAYDMANDKRRNRIVKLLMNYAYRVQYSVFELSASDSIYKRIKERILEIIQEDEDSICVYELCSTDWEKREKIGIQKNDLNIHERSFFVL